MHGITIKGENLLPWGKIISSVIPNYPRYIDSPFEIKKIELTVGSVKSV